jgi:hypothetical protein
MIKVGKAKPEGLIGRDHSATETKNKVLKLGIAYNLLFMVMWLEHLKSMLHVKQEMQKTLRNFTKSPVERLVTATPATSLETPSFSRTGKYSVIRERNIVEKSMYARI